MNWSVVRGTQTIAKTRYPIDALRLACSPQLLSYSEAVEQGGADLFVRVKCGTHVVLVVRTRVEQLELSADFARAIETVVEAKRIAVEKSRARLDRACAAAEARNAARAVAGGNA